MNLLAGTLVSPFEDPTFQIFLSWVDKLVGSFLFTCPGIYIKGNRRSSEMEGISTFGSLK